MRISPWSISHRSSWLTRSLRSWPCWRRSHLALARWILFGGELKSWGKGPCAITALSCLSCSLASYLMCCVPQVKPLPTYLPKRKPLEEKSSRDGFSVQFPQSIHLCLLILVSVRTSMFSARLKKYTCYPWFRPNAYMWRCCGGPEPSLNRKAWKYVISLSK